VPGFLKPDTFFYKFAYMNKVGIGTRVINFLIDTLVVFLISYIISKINQYYAEQFKLRNVPFKYYFNFGYLFFAVLFFYYFLTELFFKRTVGKIMSYTKVVTSNNTKPGFFQILIRSLTRLLIIDMFFIPFLDKTLHDYLSKTEVVEI